MILWWSPFRPQTIDIPVQEKFAELGATKRIWAIAAIHGAVDRLSVVHDHLAHCFQVTDRLVYLGNYLGIDTAEPSVVLDEILSFRSALLCKSGVLPSDIVYLRGPAEEAWQRLLRLQFTAMPLEALDRLLASGVEAYLRLYGIATNDARSVARVGNIAITRWTNGLRGLQRDAQGYEALICGMKRAALAQESPDGKKLVFVPASFDPARYLEDQGDSLWWSSAPFRFSSRMQNRYSRIVRGFDSVNGGAVLDEAVVTLDSGCGRGGPLMCACFAPSGQLLEIVTVGGRGLLQRFARENEAAPRTKQPSTQIRRPSTEIRLQQMAG